DAYLAAQDTTRAVEDVAVEDVAVEDVAVEPVSVVAVATPSEEPVAAPQPMVLEPEPAPPPKKQPVKREVSAEERAHARARMANQLKSAALASQAQRTRGEVRAHLEPESAGETMATVD